MCQRNIHKDWDELFQSYTSWSNPIQPVSQLTFVHLGTGTPAGKVTFKAKCYLLEEAKEFPNATFWPKCIDVKTGKTVGGMCCKHAKIWPPPTGKVLAPVWYEAGSEMARLS